MVVSSNGSSNGTLVVKSYTCAKWDDTAFVYLANISNFVELLLLSKNKQVALSYCVSHCFCGKLCWENNVDIISFIELWLLCSTVMNKNGSSMHNNITQHWYYGQLRTWQETGWFCLLFTLVAKFAGFRHALLAEHQKVASYPNESLFMNVPYILASKHGCKI